MAETALLRQLKDWYAGHAGELTAAGLTVKLDESPPDWLKTSAWLNVDSDQHLAELIVWDTGEAEFALADTTTGQVVQEHHDIHMPAALDDLLTRLLVWVRYQPS